MHDAGAELVVGIRTAAREVLATAKKRVYQSPLRVPCTGMDAHSGRLINDQQVVVLVENIERDGFRFGAKGRAGTGPPNNSPSPPEIVIGPCCGHHSAEQTSLTQFIRL